MNTRTVTTATKPPVIPSRTTNSGLVFRQKLIYLEKHLKVNPNKALSLNPDFRSAPIAAVKSVERCLSSMGLSRGDLSRVLDMHPMLLTADPHLDLYPVLDFLLHQTLIPFPLVRSALVRCPRLLLADVDSQLRPALAFLAALGFASVDCRTASLLVSSVDRTLRPKLAFLQRELGASPDEVAAMAVRSPGILTLSLERNLVPKVEFFLGEMGRDSEEVKRFPQCFSFSLEKRIRPRHRVLAAEGFRLPLPEMLKVSDGEFSARLVDMRLSRLDTRNKQN